MSLAVLSASGFRIGTVSHVSNASPARIRWKTVSNKHGAPLRRLHTVPTNLGGLLHKSIGMSWNVIAHPDLSAAAQKILHSWKSIHNMQHKSMYSMNRFYSTTAPTLTLPEDPSNWNAVQVFEWVVKNQYITKEERVVFEEMKLNGKDLLFAATKDGLSYGGLSLESSMKILEGIKYHLQPKFIVSYMNRLKPAKRPLSEIFEKQAIQALGEHEYKAKLINQQNLIKELWRSKFDHYMAFRGDDASPERINRIFITGAPGTGKTKFLLCSKPIMLEHAKTTGFENNRHYENQLQEALEKGHTFFIDWNSKETPVLRFEFKRGVENMIGSRILWQIFQPQGITWQDFILKMPPNYSFNIDEVFLACRKHFGCNVNDVVAWDILMDNIDALADLGIAPGVMKSLFHVMSRRHKDTNDVLFCTFTGASLATIDDIVFTDDPIITQIQLKSLSMSETMTHVQDLYDRGALSFLPSNWKENQNLITLLADAGGHPRTIHFVLQAVKDVLENSPASLDSLDWQSVAQKVFTSLTSICKTDNAKEPFLSAVIAKSLLTERLTVETIDEQGLALLEPMPMSDFYRMTLPFLWLQRYVAMTSPSWTGKRKLKPQVLEDLLPPNEWGFLINPAEYPLQAASWKNFVTRYEQLRTDLFIKQGESYAVLQDFFRGALGKQSWQDIEVQLPVTKIVATEDSFGLFPMDQSTKEQIDWFTADKIVQFPNGTTFSFRRALEETKGAKPRYAAVFTVSQWPQRPLTATDLSSLRNQLCNQWKEAMKTLETSLHPKIFEQVVAEQERLDTQRRLAEAEERLAALRRKKRQDYEEKRKEAFANARRKWSILDTNTTFEAIFKQELDTLIPTSQRPKQPENSAEQNKPNIDKPTSVEPTQSEQKIEEPKVEEQIDMTPEQSTAWERYQMMQNCDVVLVAITDQDYDSAVDELDMVHDSLYHWYNSDIEAHDQKQYKIAKMNNKIPDGCLLLCIHNLPSYFGPFSSRVGLFLSHK